MSSIRISSDSLHALRTRLAANQEDVAAILHQAGEESGSLLLTEWRDLLAARRGPEDPGLVDRRHFAALLREVLAAVGWGQTLVDEVGDDGLVIVVEECAESRPGEMELPSCHFVEGALAGFLSALAAAPLAVLEVECRSAGSPACHFLVGSPELIAAAADLRAADGEWRDLFGTVRPH